MATTRGFYRRASLITKYNDTNTTKIEQFMTVNGLGKRPPKILDVIVSNLYPSLNETINILVKYSDNDNKFLDEQSEIMQINWSFTGGNTSVLTANANTATFTMNDIDYIVISCDLIDIHGNISTAKIELNDSLVIFTEDGMHLTSENGSEILI